MRDPLIADIFTLHPRPSITRADAVCLPPSIAGVEMPRSGGGIHAYVVECFYPDSAGVDGFRKETFNIKAVSDEGAISEADIHAAPKGPHHYHVRKPTRTSATGTIIYRSENA
jgi:hypothetical protein